MERAIESEVHLKPRYLVTGAEMIARGALAAGVRFFAGYPITPASPIYQEMMRLLPTVGGTAIGASDEISAISYAIGASLRGTKAMTATSGPGFALMIESIGYAVMAEIPVVIVLAQRLGPATGGATTSAQGDLLFAIFSNSGGYPIPVLSPSSISDSYRTTIHAINTSEMLRTPVILLTEKATVMATETVMSDAFEGPEPIEREVVSENKKVLPYGFTQKDEVPRFIPVGGEIPTRVTGSAHDKAGILRKRHLEVGEILEHLHEKIVANIERFFVYEYQKSEGSRVAVVTFGITSRAAYSALTIAKKENKEFTLLVLKTLWPLHTERIQSLLGEVDTVIVPEENLWGHLAFLLERILPEKQVVRINSVGSLITPFQILEKVNEYAKN